MILIVVKFRPKPEHVEEWPALMQPFTAAVREEPGNLGFEWFRSVEDPGLYVLVEAFRDGSAGAEHVGSDHFQAAMGQLPHLLAEVPEIVNVETPDDGWSRMSEIEVPPSG